MRPIAVKLLIFSFIVISCKKEVHVNTLNSPSFEETALVAIQYNANDAIDYFKEHFQNDTTVDNSSLLNTTAQMLTSIGKHQEAISILEYAIKNEPQNLNLHNSIASTYTKQMNYGKAFEHYSNALEQANHDSSISISTIKSIKNRLTFIKNREQYHSYTGAYKLDNDQLLLYKFDPMLGTYPVFLNINSGQYEVLYPINESGFYFRDTKDDTTGRVIFSNSDLKNLKLKLPDGDLIEGTKLDFNIAPIDLTNDDHVLKGDLILPPGEGPHPAIVLVHGSGYSTRYNLYLEALFFASHGYAALIYDKQGTGASTGSIPLEATYQSLAGDALAAVKMLGNDTRIDVNNIGLWGFSEGGWIAPITALKSELVSHAILASGAAVNTFDQTRQADIQNLKSQLDNKSAIVDANIYMDSLEVALRTDVPFDELKHFFRSASDQSWSQYVIIPRSEWEYGLWKMLIENNPKDHLPKLNIPVLVLYGEKDQSVIPSKNIPLMRSYLEETGINFDIVTIPNANHQFMVSNDQYSPEYFLTMERWLASLSQ